ncbi:endo-1,4-beta-xylanase 1-like [Curcuma longa]|uniref:endo-1,4-beta-xylanase 1-like n=1 Tax=Curcuma longa TaxID=136217 RepID=UPI003D9F30CA
MAAESSNRGLGSELLVQKSNLISLTDDGDQNIILNPSFDDGLNNWSARGCKIALQESTATGNMLPLSGTKYFAAATERAQNWNGIQQEITGRVQRKLAYNVAAAVRIQGNATVADVSVSIYVQGTNGRDQFVRIAKLQASDKDWVQLQGKFLLSVSISKAFVYIDGPPAGVDLLVNNVVVKHAEKSPPPSPPDFSNVVYGVNLLENSNLVDGPDGLSGWFAMGSCKLSVSTGGAPRVLPPMARESLGTQAPLNGRHVLATNRTTTWMGLAQTITDKLQLHVTYQVSAWVRVGWSTTSIAQNVGVSLVVDGKWISGGQVEVSDGRWYEIGGSFRIEKPASRAFISVGGASPGVDLMVAGLQMFPVDRKARFKHLKNLTNKVRKRDVVLKITPSESGDSIPAGSLVHVKQTKNSFPLGSCIERMNLENEDVVAFFVEHFNWAVFGNELKWYWTEPQQGVINYADADDLLAFCKQNGIEVRGHCIFWEVENAVQSWVKSLGKDDLNAAVQNRLNSLLTRYKDQFRHYDVDNEMLHGSFYLDRLGNEVHASMFKTASELDPAATLFVNDYNVEGAADTRASPETYIRQVLGLQAGGAPVGGVGLQGHVSAPVGPIIEAAVDRLGSALGLPVWFTELDVPAENEYVRAEDLEVVLREAMAHPAVEGVMLWGFWEMLMWREKAHLVNADGEVNEAGRRMQMLKEEWLSRARGTVDDQGEFRFRGFHGDYTLEIVTPAAKKLSQAFTVDKGDTTLEINIIS